MANLPEQFTKQRDYLVCVDSDGCAMDTMNVKHFEYFGPLAADEFNIQNKDQFQEDWNRVNLFSSTRGINRFKALVICLNNAKEAGEDIINIDALAEWTETTSSLSNGSLEEALKDQDDESLKHALSWSQRVNKGIEEELAGNDKPFPGAKDGLAAISQKADLAIVSSANSEALNSEWTRHGLMDYVDVVYGQEAGSKKDAIANLLEHGYDKHKILMVGDAPGDLKAATDNGVLFYPIIFGQEEESWAGLENTGLDKFLNDDYAGQYQESKVKDFEDNLAKHDK
ncbi:MULTISPECIES: HAD family hydrolase [Aerococcus]|nr:MULTISPECIES: HAD hydrolase-like protein [Aerococcus]MDK6369708.1 HAD hydrolase-like protein [Aerococcus sp. UMB9870]MDK6680348.1 HAD hydrolase-like protein [Aerococcus sp. UMB8608]MDK6686927.1 HAD hydrolase-like protein [Aerococcus sp. UMB8623]MDK6940039.1 HAD hydrolase-like protein [Aerococcus sp. UMB8487]OFK21937.1 haloacid dehalogenase [Aerococcus sp. HMSC072A12]